jgi:hypothetical protein
MASSSIDRSAIINERRDRSRKSKVLLPLPRLSLLVISDRYIKPITHVRLTTFHFSYGESCTQVSIVRRFKDLEVGRYLRNLRGGEMFHRVWLAETKSNLSLGYFMSETI